MKQLTMLALFCISITGLSKEGKVYQFVGSEFPTILSYNNSGALTGSAVKIIENASKKLKFKYKITLYPWVRATQMVKQGKADVLIGPYKTVEREKYMNFSRGHFYEDQIILVTQKNNQIKWSGNLDDIADKKVGVVRGWALGKDFELHRAKLDVSYSESTEKLLQMLLLDRLEVIIIHRRSYTDDMKADLIDTSNFKVLSPPLSSQKGYFSFSKKNNLEEFMKDFDELIQP